MAEITQKRQRRGCGTEQNAEQSRKLKRQRRTSQMHQLDQCSERTTPLFQPRLSFALRRRTTRKLLGAVACSSTPDQRTPFPTAAAVGNGGMLQHAASRWCMAATVCDNCAWTLLVHGHTAWSRQKPGDSPSLQLTWQAPSWYTPKGIPCIGWGPLDIGCSLGNISVK